MASTISKPFIEAETLKKAACFVCYIYAPYVLTTAVTAYWYCLCCQVLPEACKVWQTRMGTVSYIAAEKVTSLFNDMKLYPSQSEVDEMLECTGRRTPSYLTFQEFCMFATELKRCHGREVMPGVPRTFPKFLDKDGNDSAFRRARKLQKSMCKNEVFLGGSCNPTTWRTDVAIPMLKQMEITFYNPQVSQWRPELLDLEYRAKEDATVMFFVIDNQTRSVSALIEVALIAGKQKKLILVIQSYTQQKQAICGEIISQEEYEDLRNGQEVLQDLVERQGIPVFDNIRTAVNCTAKVLRNNLTVQELGSDDLAQPKKTVAAPLEITLKRYHEAFDAADKTNSGKLSLEEVYRALEILTGSTANTGDLGIALKALDVTDVQSDVTPEDVRLNFQQFCDLMEKINQEKMYSNPLPSSKYDCPNDVYLGGTFKGTSWRESTAIPLLRENGLSFYTPNQLRKGLHPDDAMEMDQSSVLLFVISITARSLAEMAVAAHYIGLGRNVVLCVQLLPEGAKIESEELSPTAIKDYNRGRMYLMDLAGREGVPVFSAISEAVECVIEKCKNR